MRVLELLSRETPIRQGDVIVFEGRGTQRPYSCGAAVVLTADCDIAQSKHYGQLLLCPVVPIADLLRGAWAARRVQKVAAATMIKVRQELLRLLGDTEPRGLSDSTLSALLRTPDDMRNGLSAFASIPEQVRLRLERLAGVYAECTSDEADKIACLARAYSLRDSSDVEAANAKVVAEFKDEMKSDSVDVVAIPDETRGGVVASVVLLRCPFSLDASEIVIESERNADVRRIGRLCDPLKYLISQKFGMLFSRIGMPPTIEADRDIAIDLEEIAL